MWLVATVLNSNVLCTYHGFSISAGQWEIHRTYPLGTRRHITMVRRTCESLECSIGNEKHVAESWVNH